MGAIAPRILHVDTGQSWRGGQQQVAYLAEALHRGGYHTGVVSPPRSPLEARCTSRGIDCFPITMRGELDLLAGVRIARICRRRGFAILHLHSAHAVTLGIWAKAVMPSLRLVAARRVDFPTGAHLLSKMKYRSNAISRIVCISEAIRAVLIDDGIPSGKLITIRSGVDLDRYATTPRRRELREELGIPADHLVVGTVAAMAAHKDYPTFLAAANEVIRAEDQVTFCAVGDGKERERIQARALRLGLGDRCRFVGFQRDVGVYLRLFDVFVMASRTEGLGTSVIDALAVGIPAVVTRVGGLVEVVHEGRNGLLVPPGDPHALAEAIHRLVTDGDLRLRLATEAPASVREFDIARTVEQTLQLYRDIMAD